MAARDLPHLILTDTARPEGYRSAPGRGATLRRVARDRATHGRSLLEQLRSAWDATNRSRAARAAVGLAVAAGTYIEFRSDPGSDLAFESLRDRRSGIELLNVRRVDDADVATVFVPQGQIAKLTRKLERYLQEETDRGRPKNERLVESIGAIRMAVLESFWTDEPSLFPPADHATVWEVWLRQSESDDLSEQLHLLAGLDGVDLLPGRFDFLELSVVLAAGTPSALSPAVDALDTLAELRLAKSAAAFLARPRQAQAETEALQRRIQPAGQGSPTVCVIDTGVDRSHPLLGPSLAPADAHAYDPSWPVRDQRGHGTEMAGLALFGDLAPHLASTGPVRLEHRLESVKALHPSAPHHPANYGHVTAQCVARVEIAAAARPRTICMAISATDGRDRGRPSLWSAAVDDLSAGTLDDTRRLFVLSAGNVVPREERRGYPDRNMVEQVHDPGQAWNALTVGAYTDRIAVTEPELTGWSPIAALGELSPCSATSVTWESKKWPFKPDIVLEGGNSAIDPARRDVTEPDSLSLLTTSRTTLGRLLTATGDTSAAAAQAARFAAITQARYPSLWPETVRALLVHSADWTPAMTRQAGNPTSRAGREAGVRMFGYGTPALERVLSSAADDLTLIVQAEVQPFGEDGSMNEMHLHDLPWPRDVLRSLEAADVELRVTLSYFIEASPGRRGWGLKHRYASHGLRFDVQTATESVDELRARVNRAARSEEIDETASDSDEWWLGPQLRAKGSLHHDRWRGPARDLAGRHHIAVYPVLGWWRERRHLGRATRRARYALVVAIRARELNVDLYTPVATQIGVAVPS